MAVNKCIYGSINITVLEEGSTEAKYNLYLG